MLPTHGVRRTPSGLNDLFELLFVFLVRFERNFSTDGHFFALTDTFANLDG